MNKRTAKFVSAIVASFLAGAPLTTPSHSATTDCLSAPKEQTPQGNHWYYRIDRPTKHHCWYLGEEHEKTSQASLPNTSTAKSIQRTESILPPAVANARAELPATDKVELSKQGIGDNLATTTPTDVKTPSTEVQSSIIASRWPDQALPMTPFKTSANTAIGNGASSTFKPQMASIQKIEPWAAADMPSQAQDDQTGGYSLPFLLVAMASMLALAGMVTSLFLRFGGLRTRLQNINRERSDEDSSTRRTGFARTAYPARDRTSEFFAQISRRHPT